MTGRRLTVVLVLGAIVAVLLIRATLDQPAPPAGPEVGADGPQS